MVDAIDYFVKRFNLELSKKGGTAVHGINRTMMAKILGELQLKEGAEIGVAQGWHAEILCRENPRLKLHAIDAWQIYPGYREYNGKFIDYEANARKLLAPYNANIIKGFSMDAVKQFKDKSLDFVFIDGAHDFKNVAMDICEWAKKVKIGGIVYGHDYKRWIPGKSRYVVDVKDVVQAYMYSHNIDPWFELTNDLKDPFFQRDTPCWMFVRQEKDWIW